MSVDTASLAALLTASAAAVAAISAYWRSKKADSRASQEGFLAGWAKLVEALQTDGRFQADRLVALEAKNEALERRIEVCEEDRARLRERVAVLEAAT